MQTMVEYKWLEGGAWVWKRGHLVDSGVDTSTVRDDVSGEKEVVNNDDVREWEDPRIQKIAFLYESDYLPDREMTVTEIVRWATNYVHTSKWFPELERDEIAIMCYIAYCWVDDRITGNNYLGVPLDVIQKDGEN